MEDSGRLVEGFATRSWELPRTAVVVPSKFSPNRLSSFDAASSLAVFVGDDSATGNQILLIIGLNSRRPYDDDYQVCLPSTFAVSFSRLIADYLALLVQNWLRLLRLQIGNGLIAALSIESSMERAEEVSSVYSQRDLGRS